MSARRDSRLLLAALGIDSLGSGMFLPLALIYLTREVRLPLVTAGTVLTVGALVGLTIPLLVGRFVDRLGPRTVVIASQLVQCAGMLGYFVARDPVSALAAAALIGLGTQLFYSSLFTLIGEVAPTDPKDHFFAVVDMVRSACFGAGALVAGFILATASPEALGVAVLADAGSFLAGALVALGISRGRRGRRSRHDLAAGVQAAVESSPPAARTVWRNRPFLAFVAVTAATAFALDFFLVGTPVFALDQARTAAWVPGVCVAIVTVAASFGMTWFVRITRRLRRTSVIALGAGAAVLWAATSAATLVVPGGWRPWWLVGSTLLLALSALLIGTRPNALAEAIAPDGAKGSYLSVFQFAFASATVLAPLVAGLFSVSSALPWLTVATVAAAGAVGILLLAPRLSGGANGPAKR